MALSNYQSICQLRQKIIISRDPRNRQQHIAINQDRSEIYQYRIDGEVIKEGQRCDFLLWNEEKSQVYFIELKGSDLEKALAQIEQTEYKLRTRCPNVFDKCMLNYRVVLNKMPPHALYSNKVKKFKKEHGNRLICKNQKYEEIV